MEVFLIVLMVIAVSLVVTAGSLLLVWRAVQRRNRVSPRIPSAAPMVWMWSPKLAARLHRRLQAAAAVARAVMRRNHIRGGASPLGEMARALEREAVALDDHLTIVGRMHISQRRKVLPLVLAEVARIEQLAARLSFVHVDQQVDARIAEQSSSLDQLALEFDQYEQATAMLTDVEAEVGLYRTNPLRVPPNRPGTTDRTRPQTFPTWGTSRR